MYQLSIGEIKIPYTIKYSKRKSIGIEITYDGKMSVKAPINTKLSKIEELLLMKKEWILHHINHSEQRQKVKEDGEILFLGERLQIQVVNQPLNVIGIQKVENKLVIRKPNEFPMDIHRVIEDWMRRQAADMIRELVEHYSTVMNVTYNNITIKDQKTRWGSCSSKGNLNFNYRLIMAPKEVLQYVIVHELSHRVHMDHSKDFWRTVEQVIPEYRQYREWLKEYGSQLTF